MRDTLLNPEKGTWVLMCFIAFFGVIIAVNSIFVTSALKTHSGVVTAQPYKKGLAFNETLEKAQAQLEIENHITYADGVLRWSLPIKAADAKARLVRAVKQGHDFEVPLQYKGNGVYEAPVNLPLKGLWSVKLKATWNTQEFFASHDILVK